MAVEEKKEGLINGYWDSDSEWTQWNLRKISRNTPHSSDPMSTHTHSRRDKSTNDAEFSEVTESV